MSSRALSKTEEGRTATLRRSLRLMADLLAGREHDRHSAATLLDTTLHNAARHLKTVLSMLSSAKEGKRGSMATVYIDTAALRPSPSHPTAVAACFGASLWRLFERSSYGRGMRDALDYIVQGTRERTVFADIERKFIFVTRGGEPALEDKSPHLDVVTEALLECRRLAVRYKKFGGEIATYTLAPLSIAVYEHQLYLLAYNAQKRLSGYRFARILDAKKQRGSFEYPQRSQYDLDVIFRNRFGIFLNDEDPLETVQIKLTPRWRAFVEHHRWHPSQRYELRGENVIVKVDVRVCPEVKAWILGLGDEAEVLAPQWLRDEIAAVTRRMVAVYGQAGAAADGGAAKLKRGDSSRRRNRSAGASPNAERSHHPRPIRTTSHR